MNTLIKRLITCAATIMAATGVVQAQTAVPASFAHPKSEIDTSAPGFLVRLTQANTGSGELANSTQRTEDQLAGFLIDPATGVAYLNDADFSGVTLNADGTYSETFAIDYGGGGALTFPGIPGANGNISNIAMEVSTFLDLDPGTYTMIVNSDDGFQVRVGTDGRDKLKSIVLGEYSGGRGAADTQFQFTISQAGAYSFRLIYEQGGGGYNCQWYVANSTAADPHLLVNVDGDGSVKAYQKLTTASGPYVDYVSPLPDQQGVSPNVIVKARVKDGATVTVTPSTVKLYFDNTLTSAVATHDANGTMITFDPPGLLDVLSQHTIALVYTDSASNVSSNSYKFTVANFGNLQLPPPIVFEDFESVDEASLPAGWSVQNFTGNATGELDLDNPNSDSYLDWVVITDARVLSIGAAGRWDGNLRLGHPDAFVNGVAISGIVSNKFIYAESDQRGGSQVQYLFTKDYNMTGKDHLYVSYYSMYEQNQDNIGSVEYSIDGGTTWLPIVYMIDQADIKYQADGVTIDGYETLNAEQTDTASLTDPNTGEEIGKKYGAFIGVSSNLWSTLSPYISGRVNDDGMESKRVELFPIPQADNQATVRFRFAQAGTASWYFGFDNFGIYSINVVQTPPTITIASGNMAINAGQPIALSVTATGTAPLTYEWSKNGTVVGTSSTFNIASASAADSGKYTITVRNVKGAATKDIIVNVIGSAGNVPNGLVVHLPFNDNYNDTSGRANNATAAGTPDFQAGKLGKALHVKSTTDGTVANFASLGYPDDLKFTDATDFSISMWVNVTSQTDDHPFISNKNWDSSGNQGWGIFTQSGGNIRDQVTGTGGTRFSTTIPNPPVNWKDNSWHNIVVTFKRGVESVAYFDGVPVSTAALLTTGTIDTDPATMAVNIGQDGRGTYTDGGSSSLDALIDDVGVWRRILTSDEAGTIYLNGLAGKDLSTGAVAEFKITSFTVSGGQLHLTISGAVAGAKLQQRADFNTGTTWQDAGAITGTTVDIPISTTGNAFFRVVNP
jgi:hypothetical protein